ncbi:Ribonucleoside-diphosphate reductase [Candidatus Filomicrobium marinum]|uniref:Vitamin B12-dependent ribonucleotide reductase n=2 Tax=Filomicrobium TaxID=119044 RepID=A0A0D6JEK9_9HYPH|nr:MULTISPECIES: adenosylcobalamin-dependent ribonucleoside-diphosphate reductase [Filomicrobium]CFX17071.1 Ribonucleoside-diphosphate reductase [Candidatus Filomicrobium marinum]CPR18185.1 Ribonucleoside-diphosphate reductase [Candidatus Filomicrobium marinum]SDO22657.1 ribonucleoside-diphosphate reductase class II [Filomicrobium insigne]
MPHAKTPGFFAAIAEAIWNGKYRLIDADGAAVDKSLADTFARVARAAASVEKGGAQQRQRWEKRYFEALADFGFLPAGRILAGAGSQREVTLFNCFVMGTVPDDLRGIFDSVRDGALTMQMGGGIGVDFSTLRPKGALVKSIGADASGPVSFMEVWDAMCRTIMSAGARRGAMMATLRDDHPDIEDFIEAKSTAGRLTNFNLSVLVSDKLMQAVADDAEWDLVFDGKVYRRLPARDLWQRIMRATYTQAEPGVIFIDRVNARNNLSYCETIRATNPCGEQPLPPFGACLLGSLNLTQFIRDPFTADAHLDIDSLQERVAVAVRFLDNMIDVTRYPLTAQKQEAKAKRRMGLGVTGLADALIMCRETYGSTRALKLAESWLRTIEVTAYRTSVNLARERGSFPLCDAKALLQSPNIIGLPDDIKRGIEAHGLRNGCLTSVAPTGTISLLAGNVSSGIEPVFDFIYQRNVLDRHGGTRSETIEDYAHAVFRRQFGEDVGLPDYFVRADQLTPRAHLEMQAAIQRHVDSSISKTINCPAEMTFEAFSDVYSIAYELGLKGCTTYRPSALRGAVLSRSVEQSPPAPTETEVSGSTARTGAPQAPVKAAAVHYMAKPLEREPALQGYTYKLKWPGSDHALYVTINDIVRDGRRRPFEIFINSKNLEHYAWMVALTRMISAVFRRGGDVSFVAEELTAIFDPQGGRWIGGRYVPSLIAAIGEIIEEHMRRIDFMPGDQEQHSLGLAQLMNAGSEGPTGTDMATPTSRSEMGDAPSGFSAHQTPAQCPRCGSAQYVRLEGCWECQRCGFSRCD